MAHLQSLLKTKGRQVELDPLEKRRIQEGAEKHFFDILRTFSTIPRELLLIMKTNDLLRAMNRDLNTTFNAFRAVSYYCQLAVNKEAQRVHPGFFTQVHGSWELGWLQFKFWLASFFVAAF